MKPERSRPARRGIYVLPTLFTLGNILCGFSSIVSSADGAFALAANLIVLAAVLDALDGKVARLAHATSAFGLELDSLADVVSFGVAPAMLAYSWGIRGLPRLGWVAGFFFLIAGAMRLARFNAQAATADSRYFVGLPIPIAAGTLAAVVSYRPDVLRERTELALAVGLIFVLSFLMVSTVRYHSFKDLDLQKRQRLTTLLWLVLLLCVVALHPQAALLVASVAYTLSGPVLRFISFLRPRPPEEASTSRGAVHHG